MPLEGNEPDDYGLKDKTQPSAREGFPVTISISCKTMCPWKNDCKGAVDGFNLAAICTNYDPASLDYDEPSLKCKNWEPKEEYRASLHKQKNVKRVRKPRAKHKTKR